MAFINYENKICVVTGSSEGIGYEVAKALLEYKAIVYGLDIKPTNLSGINYIECDLSKKESIDRAFSIIPAHIDSFFGNAAINGIHSTFSNTYTIIFVANKYITDTYLKKRMSLGGSIAFVNSFLGNYWDKYSSEFRDIISLNTWEEMQDYIKNQNNDNLSGIKAYPLAKRALNYYMAHLSLELGRSGIRVNTVVPGTTDTKLIDDFKNSNGQINQDICQTGVADRMAYASEIASSLIFINSNMASYINGVLLHVDYGNNMQYILGMKTDKFDLKINSSLFNFGTDLMLSNNVFAYDNHLQENNSEEEIL